jgi:hypothetical protein
MMSGGTSACSVEQLVCAVAVAVAVAVVLSTADGLVDRTERVLLAGGERVAGDVVLVGVGSVVAGTCTGVGFTDCSRAEH